nr:glycosyltransferase family 4 protein [uncultured Methanoregula sp.]
MKIAFIYDAIYPFVKGGVEKRVWELAVRLTRDGHDVHLFGMKFWDGDPVLIRDGVTVHGVCPAQSLYANGRRTFRQAWTFSSHLIRPLLRERFDIIDCQQFPYFPCFSAKIVSVMKKTPLVITWHEVWGDYWYTYLGRSGFFGKHVERLVLHATGNVVAVSPTTSNQLKDYGFHGDITIIPNGIDPRRIHATSPSKEKSDLIFVGRLIREKHVDLLVRAFSKLLSEQPDRTLLIIGDGPEREAINALIHDLLPEDRVRIIGFRDDHDEIIAHMKSAKIAVLPSTREGFGITALEALACGLPVITIDHPANAIRDLITGNNGFLSSLSPDDLAQTIQAGLNDADDMRDACIASAEGYDWDRIATQLEQYYQSVIEAARIS